jgi:hypothetical protein
VNCGFPNTEARSYYNNKWYNCRCFCRHKASIGALEHTRSVQQVKQCAVGYVICAASELQHDMTTCSHSRGLISVFWRLHSKPCQPYYETSEDPARKRTIVVLVTLLNTQLETTNMPRLGWDARQYLRTLKRNFGLNTSSPCYPESTFSDWWVLLTFSVGIKQALWELHRSWEAFIHIRVVGIAWREHIVRISTLCDAYLSFVAS